jgi:lysophospholipase L1-like esterase
MNISSKSPSRNGAVELSKRLDFRNKVLVYGLIISLVLNVLGIGVFVYRCGSRMLEKREQSHRPDKIKNDTTGRPYYLDRSSQFRALANLGIHSNDTVVFLGDSITDACEWSEFFPEIPVVNRGIGGDTATGLLARLESSLIRIKPSKVFIMIGTNDIACGVQTSFIIGEYKRIVMEINKHVPNADIFVESVLPTRDDAKRPNSVIIQLNSQLKDMSRRMDVKFINHYSMFLDDSDALSKKYSSDGLHLNGDGYVRLAGILSEYIASDVTHK